MPAAGIGKQHHPLAIAIGLNALGEHALQNPIIGARLCGELIFRNGPQAIELGLRRRRPPVLRGEADIGHLVVIVAYANAGCKHRKLAQCALPDFIHQRVEIIIWCRHCRCRQPDCGHRERQRHYQSSHYLILPYSLRTGLGRHPGADQHRLDEWSF